MDRSGPGSALHQNDVSRIRMKRIWIRNIVNYKNSLRALFNKKASEIILIFLILVNNPILTILIPIPIIPIPIIPILIILILILQGR